MTLTHMMYDAIIVGARCAGASTALLLARKGARVLLVDRATVPSDTISGHAIRQPGVAYLKRWGLLESVIATGAPAIYDVTLAFGNQVLPPPDPDPNPLPVIGPRRTIFDRSTGLRSPASATILGEIF
jgi:2-polyprenyl-6-methoxyphenol hydroxylase-like FAD-dependent oxidoreductase